MDINIPMTCPSPSIGESLKPLIPSDKQAASLGYPSISCPSDSDLSLSPALPENHGTDTRTLGAEKMEQKQSKKREC